MAQLLSRPVDKMRQLAKFTSLSVLVMPGCIKMELRVSVSFTCSSSSTSKDPIRSFGTSPPLSNTNISAKSSLSESVETSPLIYSIV